MAWRWPILMVLCLWHGLLAAEPQPPDEQTLLQLYGNEELLSIATGSRQPLAKAPAVTTLITAEDIKAIGATDLDEVLETVPGLHVARDPAGYNPNYTIRGIYSSYNPQVLFLINGIPITNFLFGNRNEVWGGMPVQAIARIEVIRGPGSAVYGADAFAGVINIVTKTKDDIRGTQVGGRVGSFATHDGWALHGGRYGGFDVAAMVEYHQTAGPRPTVEADAQTFYDQLFGTHASLAPGPVNLQRDNLDLRLDLARGGWRFRGGLQHRRDIGTGAGVAQALDPQGRFGSDRWNADLTYHSTDLAEDWDLTAQVSYFDTSQTVQRNVLLYPPGAFGGAFPQGMIGNPEVFERQLRANLSGFYTGFDQHLLRVGLGFNYFTVYRIRELKNYTLVPNEPPLPLGALVDVSDTRAAFLTPGNRKDYFFFVQDEWKFAPDWELTLGLRYDYYSDFGDTTNPRLALVWETRQDLTTKLLYGRAFRAPSLAEMRNRNNPVAIGNPALKPETIDTVELAFDYRPTDRLRLGLNLFQYWWNDQIRFTFVPDLKGDTLAASNTGKQTGHGLELEADWRLADEFRVTGNYSWQNSTDETTHHDPGYAPRDKVYLRTDWEFLPDWHFTPQVDWVMNRRRPLGDHRPPIPDYAWVDLTLRRKRLHDHFELAFSIRNLFDVDAREPSPAGIPTALIPYDLPLAGRSFYGEIRIDF